MIVFMSIFVAMVLLALSFVIVPLLRAAPKSGPHNECLTVLADSVRELEAELACGTISRAEYESARRDLESQALESDGIIQERKSAGSRGRWATALAIAIGLPVTVIMLYAVVGQPAASSGARAPGTIAGAKHERAEAAITTLARRLEKDGSNGEGWILLARSYVQVDRIPESLGAYRKAVAILPENADLLVEYANALAIGNQRRLTGEPEQLAERALQIDPNNLNALAFSGLAALQREDRPRALERWRRLESLLPADSDDRQRIATLIAQAEGKETMPSARRASPAEATAQGGQVALAATKSAEPLASTVGPEAIRGRVTLAGVLAGKVAPTDTLFVFAKAIDGPPMPLAAVRTRAGDLPLSFTLDDSSAMVQGMMLSKFPRVSVVARISRLGSATAQPGDIEGIVENVALGSNDVRLVMDRVVGR